MRDPGTIAVAMTRRAAATSEAEGDASCPVAPLAIVIGATLLLAACAAIAPPRVAVVDARAACIALAAPAAASAYASAPVSAAGGAADSTLVGGARVVAAEWIAAAPLAVEASGVFTPAAPGHCRLQGRIAASVAGAPPVDFVLALPDSWNGRALQFGDDALDALPFDGRAPVPGARIDRAGPLALGYATYGVVAPHRRPAGPAAPDHTDAALVDLAHASHKKAHDAALALIQRRHGRAPQRVYFVGSSEGGRAALAMAQRYAADFDAIFARVPLVQWTGLQHARWRGGLAQRDGGWLRPAQVRWWAESVRLACDELDGLADGIVAAQEACGHVLRPELLRCPDGAPAGDWCLGDRQLRAVQTLLSPYRFDFELAHGVRSYPGWVMGGEGLAPAGAAGGWLAWWSGLRPPTWPPGSDNGLGWQQASAAISRWIVRDEGFDLRSYEPGRFAERLQQVSALMDATNSDLSAFAARGGKLLMLEHMADQARSPHASVEYFEALRARMGEAGVDAFARLYLAYGVDHVGQGAPSSVDMLAVMVDWVERGWAPGALEVATQQRVAPFAVTLTRPLCRWPMFPRYRGEGDTSRAASFACALR